MSLTAIGVIGIIVLLFLLFSRMWVGATMMIVGILGSIYIGGLDLGQSIAGMVPFSNTASYTMACIPMFILMGIILSVSGVGADLYEVASKWIGQVRGGLAMATTVACGFFAAVCGQGVGFL